METQSARFRKFALHPLKFRLFLLAKLPMAFWAGLHLSEIDEHRAEVRMRYGYFTKNPFRSIYFACLSMAAELSTGALVLQGIYNREPSFSMLVFSMKADFHKKATGTIRFVCEDGKKVKDAVAACLTNPGEGQTVTLLSKGFDQSGACVATFSFEWTLKQRQA
jgi:hypothetical protein